MSEAVAVLHGAFGRVCLYSMDRTMVPHAHREGHLLFHVQGGPAEVYVDGCAIPLGPGQAVAVSPWQTHFYSQPVPGEQTIVLVLYIRPTWFRNAIGSRASALRFGCGALEVSHVLGRLMDVSAMLDRNQDDPAINDWLLALTEYCFDKSWHGSDAVGRCPGIHDFRLRKAIQLLEQRVSEPVELDAVAREAGLSRPHFYKLFRQQVGVTPTHLSEFAADGARNRPVDRNQRGCRGDRARSGLFQSGKLLALLHRQWRRPAQRLSAQRADRLFPMNHKFASNVRKSVKSLDCRIRPVRPEATILSNKHVATAGSMGTLQNFSTRHPIWTFVVLVLVVGLAWLIVAPWPPGLEQAMGRKRVFLNAILSGITLGALYFLVASGFTLVFGLMRNVNLAHGSLYLLGGYIGYGVVDVTGYWLLAFPVVFILVGALGLLLQHQVFRRMEGEELRQTLVTIGISIVLADLMLWFWGGQSYQVLSPDWLSGPTTLPLISSIRANGEAVYLSYPRVRIAILIAAIVIGLAMWFVLNRSRLGMLIRAGVDDRDILAASGVRIQYVFLAVFAFGAGMAGMAGIVGGTFQSLSPGEDTRFLLASLVVVIVGGMGSIPGAALGAVIIGLAEQIGLVYAPTYSVVFTFLIMAAVLAFRPQGLLGAQH